MKAAEWVDLIFLRLNLAICAVCLAVTIAACVSHVLTPGEMVAWFVFGLVEGTLSHFLPRMKLRSIQKAKEAFPIGIAVLLVLAHSSFYPNGSLLNTACHLAANLAGLSLVFCIFRKKFVLSAVQKAQELQALRSRGTTLDTFHFRD